METKRPKVGVGVCVKNSKSEVLLFKRKGAHGDGTWSFPGGHLEFNESWQACAIRETKEEAGITIKNVKFMGVTNDIMRADDKHYITIFMEAEIKSGKARLMEPDKSTQFGWFSVTNLPRPLFIPLRNFLKKNKI